MTIKVKLVVTHIQTGIKFDGGWQEIEPDGVSEVKSAIKDNLQELTYLELGDTIVPGDFIRNHCVIDILTA